MLSDVLARPSGMFVLRERYTRVECEEPDYLDLWAEIRTNLSHDEREEFVDASNGIKRELRDYLDARLAKAAALDKAFREAKDEKAKASALSKRNAFLDEQDKKIDTFRLRRIQLIAPYIRAWNVGALDEHGEEVSVAAPKAGGIGSFVHVDDVVVAWLIEQIENGYRSGKGLRTRLAASGPTPEPTNEPPSENETEPSS